MRTLTNKVSISLWFILSVSCSEIFVEDISKTEIELISPSDSIVTTDATLTFWWQEVNDATNYHLQIVQPNFNVADKIVLDTNITAAKFSYSLFPGQFQWRVKAINSAYETEYMVRTLTIDSTADLSNTYPILNTPTDNLATRKTSVVFEWQSLYNASQYRFILKEKNWDGAFIMDTTLKETIKLPLELEEGAYSWGVRAINEISQSPFSHRALKIDRTKPPRPVLLIPKDKDTINTTLITFQWKRPDRSGTEIKDSLIVAKDSTFTDLMLVKQESDTIYNWNPTDESIDEYFWRIKSLDRAGNQSDYSDFKKFFRNEK